MAKKRQKAPHYQSEAEAREKEDKAQGKGKLGKGCIRGIWHRPPGPRYCEYQDYYEDYPFTCIDCGAAQIWTAQQQKWWYEKAGGSIYAFPLHCRACRQALVAAHRGTPRRSHRDRHQETDNDRGTE